MKKYAVAYVSFFDNELNITFVRAPSIREAANVALKYEDITELPEDLEELKQFVSNMDGAIDVKEMPASVFNAATESILGDDE